MNEHALRVLEFDRVLELVAQRATSELGAARVRRLTPTDARAWIDAEHARVGAMRAVAAGGEAWRPEPIPDLEAPLARLRVEGSVWTGSELLAGRLLLQSSRVTRDALTDEQRDASAVATLALFTERLVVMRAAEHAIERAIDREGLVKDEASPELRRVRRELRDAQGQLVGLLERMMSRLEPHQRVLDMSVTVRNGRYVIPIRREARGAVGGIVHDESATRATLFVEPPAAVEAGNRIRELEAEEVREVQRVLRELTGELRPHRDDMAHALDTLVELDSLYARARYADEYDCAAAELAQGRHGFEIRNGRHPLLLAGGGEVVPFDLEMQPNERTLLLSGPNTGGKTVLLKALGLASACAQAGIPAPVGAGSHLAIFDDFFADIGDEQSIQASLSTFSAHLRNLGEILAGATADSLVLIDELGSGTDPAEGAALGGAVLEELTRRRALTVATTHLGALKLLATEVPGVVNASLQFDDKALAPTYRLVKGYPGRSYGLSIARRLRLPPEVLARAEERLPRGERDVAALLADLERRDAALAERERTVGEHLERAESTLARVAERERALREGERELERRARQETRQYLLEARAEVERTIRDLAQSAGGADDGTREARRRIEALAGEQARALAELERADSSTGPREEVFKPPMFAVGDTVQVEMLGGRTGQVVEIRDGEAVVAVGTVKLAVPPDGLRRVSTRGDPPEAAAPRLSELPDVHAPTEIDVRGMRVEEVEQVVLQALDSAVRADLRWLRIIHGKGTGALRERVGELLRGDPRVREYRLGAWNEGGAGVTVASLA